MKFPDRTFEPRERVDTPLGPGSVVYQRLAPPTYRYAASVFVVLDTRRGTPRYTGTVFQASDVVPVACP